MPIQTVNKTSVPVGSDPYALTADLKKTVEGLRTIIPVADKAERDALPSPFEGMTVERSDLNGALEVFTGGAWPAPKVEYFNFSQVAGWALGGTLMLERKGGRKTLSGTLTILRTGSAFSIGTGFSNFGNVVPAGALLGNGENLYHSAVLSGGGSTNFQAQVFLNPTTGQLQVRGLSAFSWPSGGVVTISFVVHANAAGL
ncbi:minor tail protein [Arthrobacter phage Jamun]|nr:minor tail protein [Arthrobacter phage Jamun]WNM65693.1 minor tail protein [Arthrobacter phage Vulpecula]